MGATGQARHTAKLVSAITFLMAAGITGGLSQEREVSIMQAICEPAAQQQLIMSPDDLAGCRALWKQRVSEARLRSQLMRDQAAIGRRQAAAASPSAPARKVTIGTFLDDDLAYGDVVTTSGGAKVYIGRSGEPAQAGDFVSIDDPRSPHRKSLQRYAGAMLP